MLRFKYKKSILQSAIIVSLVIVFGSCNKDLDTNLQNPNGVGSNTLTGKDIFASALVNTTSIINAGTIPQFTNEWMGIWARTTSYSAAGAQYQIETFGLNNAYGDNFWGVLYHNIYDYQFVTNKSTASSILPGAALVMQALVFQDLVDIFGDVPYSQAASTSLTPAYDKDQAIYGGLVSKLDSAMTLINSSQSTADDAADVMFKGDKNKWLQFANTIKLRVLLRQIPNIATASSLQAEMAKTVSYGFLSAGTDATVNPGFADVVNKQSPFWASYGFQAGGTTNPYQNNTFYVANQTMIDFLKSVNDPRLGYLYKANTTDGYAGNYLGDASAAKPVAQLSSIGSGILKSAAMDAIVLTASESLFLQSEAAQRGLISGDYKALFTTAVAESFRYLGVTNPTTAATSYINGSADDRVNISLASDPIKTIIYQKWISLAETDGLEIWCDYRKTGYPDRTKPSVNPAATTNTVPSRMLYPQTEINQNNANYSSENQVNSDIYKKIFWGK